MKRITALICALLLVLSLGACGKANKPEKTAEAFFEALKKMDFDGMNACTMEEVNVEWDPADMDMFSDETVQQLLGVFQSFAAKIEYVLGEATVTGDTATVPATVTYADASSIVRDAMTDVMANMFMTLLGEESEADVYTQLIQAISDKAGEETVATKTDELVLPFTKTDDGWKLSALSDELMNVISANMGDAFAEAESALTE